MKFLEGKYIRSRQQMKMTSHGEKVHKEELMESPKHQKWM